MDRSEPTAPISFPVTICVVCYGDNAHLAQQFVSNLYTHTDPALFSLRAGLNEVVDDTLQIFSKASKEFGNVELFVAEKNIYKDAMLGRIFTERPIDSEWLITFDDDSYPTRPDWLQRLALKIERQPEISHWGQLHAVDVGDDIKEFVETASWGKGIPLRLKDEADPDSPYQIIFAVGGFGAIRSSVIELLSWPDPRIIQSAGDFLLGEALRQNGLEIGPFDYGLVVNGSPRRNAEGDGFHRLRSNA